MCNTKHIQVVEFVVLFTYVYVTTIIKEEKAIHLRGSRGTHRRSWKEKRVGKVM